MLPCFDLTGKTALVTGGSAGIGRELAKALALSGANISLVARRIGPLQDACEELKALGANCIYTVGDISDELSIRNAVDRTVEAFGALDNLIDNAAVDSPNKPVEELTVEEWRFVIERNVDGMFIVAKEAARVMIPQKRGNMVLLCSIASEIFHDGTYPGVYEVSKGAVSTLVRVLSANWCKYNIHVNGIAPGYFHSEAVDTAYKDRPEDLKIIADLVPAKRLAYADELGPVCVLLSSSGASYIDGTVITVDGGRSYK